MNNFSQNKIWPILQFDNHSESLWQQFSFKEKGVKNQIKETKIQY